MVVLTTVQQQTDAMPMWLQASLAAALAGVVFVRQWLTKPDVVGVTSKTIAALLTPEMLSGLAMAVLSVLQQNIATLPHSAATTINTLLLVIPMMLRGNVALAMEPPAKA